MIARINGSEENQAREIAEKIINAIACGNYVLVEEITDNMGEWDWDAEGLGEFIETFKSDNELECFDKYEVVCNFNVVYKDGSRYEQEKFYHLNDGTGFRYEYDFTTNGDLNDLTLMLNFIYRDDFIEVGFEDVHVL